jgi:hypothetical protein
VTVDYDLDPAQPKASFKVSNIDLSDYPPDRPGPVTRFLNNGPALQKLSSGVSLTGLVASLGAQGASEDTRKKIEWVIQPIQSYFRKALADARKEFHKQFPDADSLWSNSGVDRHRQVYEAAAAKLKVPQNARAAAAVLIALANEQDREEALRRYGPKLNKIGVSAEDLTAFHDAGAAYESTMIDLRERLERHERPLPEIAADIRRRATVLGRAGKHLEDAYWGIIQSPGGTHPVIYYPALRIYYVSTVFQGLGEGMAGFADEVASRASGYEHVEEKLDKELTWVGARLNDFGVPSPRERGSAR